MIVVFRLSQSFNAIKNLFSVEEFDIQHKKTEKFRRYFYLQNLFFGATIIVFQYLTIKSVSMSQKTIVINFQEPVIPIQAFKNALHIFNIKRVHLNKVNAYVEFKNIKDYQAFHFTNYYGKIPSLHGASYELVQPDFRWKFPSHDYRVESLLKDEREETQPGSQDQIQHQENAHQQVEEGSKRQEGEKNHKLNQTPEDLNEALRIQRMKEEQWRNSHISESEDTYSQIENQVMTQKKPQKNYIALQNRIKEIIAKNWMIWPNKTNNFFPQEKSERIYEAIQEHLATLLVVVIALIILIM